AKAAADVAGGCEIIDYVRPHTLQTNRVFQPGLSPGALAKNAHTLLRIRAFRRRYGRFEAFMRETMPLGPKRYLTIEELTAEPPLYDRCLCGSDQIWNPEIFSDKRFDPAFFLAFIKNAPKAAYAPSFGPAVIEGAAEERLRALLDGFTRLSARERRGAELLSRVTGRPVPVVLDPTLLLTRQDWAALAAKEAPGKAYLLCYFVSPPGRLAELAHSVKNRTGAAAVQLAGARRRAPGVDKVIFDAGPREFLALFQNAGYVLTNSFHGVVFSILFEKPFTCGAGGGEDAGLSRTGHLLSLLGLTDRLLSGGGTPNLSGIDYGAAGQRLQAERERSLAFLRDALTGGTGDV
ncbi:MAG: polysaccharide pyruvyl transferase family protein, partial [Oscillospiraceae bacterium]|nr:polysaccharide pyruvyl transferase family protein [Oscillospiraceae bacterium]